MSNRMQDITQSVMFCERLTMRKDKRMNPTCEWAMVDSDGYTIWETGCDIEFEFSDGGPKENNFKYCPYCGREIRTVNYES